MKENTEAKKDDKTAEVPAVDCETPCYAYKCTFSTDISETLSCSRDGKFDYYGFPEVVCELFPCEKYNKIAGA